MFAALAIAALLIGCTNAPQEKADALADLISTKNYYIHQGKLAGIGIGTSSNEQVAYEKADQSARVDLAKLLDAQVQSITKIVQEQVNIDGVMEVTEQFQNSTKSVVETRLSGANLSHVKVESTSDGKVKVYGVMLLETKVIDEYILSIENSELRISESQKDLIRELAKKVYDELEETFPLVE